MLLFNSIYCESAQMGVTEIEGKFPFNNSFIL
jgi:hypothetical protein